MKNPLVIMFVMVFLKEANSQDDDRGVTHPEVEWVHSGGRPLTQNEFAYDFTIWLSNGVFCWMPIQCEWHISDTLAKLTTVPVLHPDWFRFPCHGPLDTNIQMHVYVLRYNVSCVDRRNPAATYAIFA